MGQKYKIFINGKLLFLVRNPADVEEILASDRHFIIQPYEDEVRLLRLLDMLKGDINSSDMVIYHRDPDLLLQAVLAQFHVLNAGGGVVRNAGGDYLLIFRRGHWDLPKGKTEEGEALPDTARREVEEETGAGVKEVGEMVRFPGLDNTCSYHYYREKGKDVIKASYWYHMSGGDNGRLKPQAEEDIDRALWVAEEDLVNYYPEMYPSIVEVLEAARRLGDTPSNC